MRRFATALLALSIFAAPAARGQSLDGPFPRLPSPEARAQAYAAGFRASAPPAAPVRAIAEFERSEAVVVSYSSWVTPGTQLPLELIRLLSENVRVISLHNNPGQKAGIEAAYANAGVTMSNVEFFDTNTNSIWTRDYGPFYIADGNREIGIVDFVYDVLSRPLDNNTPAALAGHLDMPLYTMDLAHVGGNYMVTGYGSAISTDRLLSTNSGDEALVRQRTEDYLGIEDYFIFPDPQDTYIDHIDTWGKFLDVDKILIAQASPGHPDYDALEAIADEFAETPSPWGTPYQVFRVFAPQRQPYTNSLIVNDHVYVATDGKNPALDAAAVQTYRDAMPGYTIHGVEYPFWLSTDALHCRTKEVADRGLLSVRHTPVPPRVPAARALTVDAEIIAYSGAALLEDDLHLIYRTGAAPFDTLALANVGGDTFRGTFPALRPGTAVEYYFSASDASGRTETFPLVGPAAPRTFRVVSRPAAGAPAADAPASASAEASPALSLEASPNPTRGALTVAYTLPAAATVTLEVYDALGRRVASLWEGPLGPGAHHATWDARGVPAGVYLVRLSAGGEAPLLRRVTVAR